MPTTQLHPQYASGITGSNYKGTNVERPGDVKDAGPETKNSKPHKKSKGASNVYEERFLFGMFSDLVKNVAKIMTGSLFTDLIKGILKDKNQTWEQVLYSTLVDSGPSRLFTDYINAFAVRTMSFLPPELSSQIFATPSVLFFRAATSGENVNAKSARKGASAKEEKLREEVLKQPFVKWVRGLSGYFETNIKPGLDRLFQVMLGVTAGEKLKDKNGNLILNKDGKEIKSNPIVNLKRLIATASAFVLGTALLPRHTKQTGSDLVDTPLRATVNTITTSLFRLNTTLLHNGVGAHVSGGANFDKCYNAAIQEKTLTPLVQYTSDNVGALLSKYIPMNGAILGIITRLITEIPVTFLSAGLVNFSKKDRLTDQWRILGQRVCMPFTNRLRDLMRPLYRTLAYHGYSKLGGIFNPKIENMYDVDLSDKENKEVTLDKELDAKYSKGVIPTAWMLSKETLGLIPEIFGNLFPKCKVDSEAKVNMDKWVQKAVNRRLDFEKLYGFRAPTHGTEEEKANLTDEQRQKIEHIEAKELSRHFKILWDDEKQSYKRISVPLPSIEDESDKLIDPIMDSDKADDAKPSTSYKQYKEEVDTRNALLHQQDLQQAA